MAAAVVITLMPLALDWHLHQTNKKRQAQLEQLPSDHVFPAGPVGHLDGECHAFHVMRRSLPAFANLH
jgi:hypothetical protein